MVEVRDCESGFTHTQKLILPLPLPEICVVNVSQVVLEVADQAQPLVARTLRSPFPPAEPKLRLEGEMTY